MVIRSGAVGSMVSVAGLIAIQVLRTAPAFGFVPQHHHVAVSSYKVPCQRRVHRSQVNFHVGLGKSSYHSPHYSTAHGASWEEDTGARRDDEQPQPQQQQQHGGSYIESIQSHNIVGMVNGDDGSNEITMHLADEPNLVAVTGETGSGKSVLIAKVANLVTGGTASPTMLPPISERADGDTVSQAVVVMTIQLAAPHLSMVESACKRCGLDPSKILSSSKIVLKRTLSLQPASRAGSKQRLKSTCEINDEAVTLKAMKAIAGPLLTIVDAAAAAAALSRPNSRLSVVDTAVPMAIKVKALTAKTAYRKARQYREQLERELNTQVLPPSYSHSDDPNEEAIAMLRHWVEELDAFEERMMRFRDSAVSPIGSGSIDSGDEGAAGSAQLADTLRHFRDASWFDCADDGGSAAVSEFYSQLLSFREIVKSMDAQLSAAISARDVLSALSSPDSAITALERARNHLYDATGGKAGNTDDSDENSDSFGAAAESTHERLNAVENALSDCVRSLDDSNKGLVAILERMVGSIGASLEDIDTVIADWNTLARKHAIPPFSLPSCHRSLRSELDGSVEARTLLPKAKATEQIALQVFEDACTALTSARHHLCGALSEAVTERLPSLGILSKFEARLNDSVQQCTDPAAYGEGSGLGVDSIDFLLRHQSDESSGGGEDEGRGGKLESIGSAGEKARILLAIETEFPGSVGALCGRDVLLDSYQGDDVAEMEGAANSVAVIYDEIDAHVGGRAAVAIAKLLVDQTRPPVPNGSTANGGGQVICITHSPSVAAAADRHVVIQKAKASASYGRGSSVFASLVDGESREEELGRMCGGDVARDEALQFAAALLRDRELQKSAP